MRFFFAKTGKFAIIFSKKYGGVAEWTIAPVFPALKIWKRGRAVYGVGLENQLGRNPLGGSNPPASAFYPNFSAGQGKPEYRMVPKPTAWLRREM